METGIGYPFTLLFTPPLLAAEYFVSPTTGNDSNPGTSEASPLKTWPAGDARLVAGDTLTLLDGTYPIGAVTKSGTPDAWITLRQEPAESNYFPGGGMA